MTIVNGIKCAAHQADAPLAWYALIALQRSCSPKGNILVLLTYNYTSPAASSTAISASGRTVCRAYTTSETRASCSEIVTSGPLAIQKCTVSVTFFPL